MPTKPPIKLFNISTLGSWFLCPSGCGDDAGTDAGEHGILAELRITEEMKLCGNVSLKAPDTLQERFARNQKVTLRPSESAFHAYGDYQLDPSETYYIRTGPTTSITLNYDVEFPNRALYDFLFEIVPGSRQYYLHKNYRNHLGDEIMEMSTISRKAIPGGAGQEDFALGVTDRTDPLPTQFLLNYDVLDSKDPQRWAFGGAFSVLVPCDRPFGDARIERTYVYGAEDVSVVVEWESLTQRDLSLGSGKSIVRSVGGTVHGTEFHQEDPMKLGARSELGEYSISFRDFSVMTDLPAGAPCILWQADVPAALHLLDCDFNVFESIALLDIETQVLPQ